jgi:membrane protease YdiL (CAAX protease family)
MHPPKSWLPGFIVLFVAYQLPEGIGGRWLHNASIAAMLMLAFLPIAVAVARALGRGPGSAYALEWTRPGWHSLTVGLLLAFAAKGLALAAGLRWGVYKASPDIDAAVGPAALAGTLAWLAFATFVPSIAEDIVTRGFWLRLTGLRWTGASFVLGTSVLYVLNHVYRLGNGPGEWAMLFCYGLAYGTACWIRGSLWAAVGLHWGWNLASEVWALVWPTSAVEPELARAISGTAHLMMLAAILAWWGWTRRGAPGTA